MKFHFAKIGITPQSWPKDESWNLGCIGRHWFKWFARIFLNVNSPR